MSPQEFDFGPNHANVVELLERTRAASPYRNLGEPTDVDGSLVRVDFVFLAAHRNDLEGLWDGNLAVAENAILEACRETARWSLEDAIQRAVFRPTPPTAPDPVLDDLLIYLDETYGTTDEGYFPDTHMFPHELFYDFFPRILLGAAMETALSDALPKSTFFRSLLPWLRDGHLPCGWRGRWPSGQLLLW